MSASAPRNGATPVYDIDAEQAVVASLMVDAEAISKVHGILRPQDFYREQHRWTYEACLALSERGESINQITVAHVLSRQRIGTNGRSRLEEVGGPGFLSLLVNELPTPIGVEHYASIVHRDAGYRHLAGAAAQIAQLASEGGPDPAAVMERAVGLLTPIAEQAAAKVRRGDVAPLADFMKKEWGAGEPIVDGWVSTGDIIWWYGQVGHGKTLEAVEIAVAVATRRALFGQFSTSQGTVMIVEEDCHPQKLQQYLSTLLNAYGIEDAPIFIWERQFLRLDDDAAADAFFAEVQRVKPVLIILDAFLDLHSGDGFTGHELRPVLDRIASLPQLLPCAVVVLDHTRKETPGAKLTDPIDALYGGRMKAAMADKMILTKRVSEVPLRFDISMPKTRDEPRAPIQVTFTAEEGFAVEDAPPTITPASRTVAEWASRQPAGSTFTRKAIEEGTGLSPRTVKAAVPELLYNRLLERTGKQGRAELYGLPSADDNGPEQGKLEG